MTRIRLITAACAAVLTVGVVDAHHSGVMFEEK